MNLSLEEEVRKEFDEWFKAASVRDVDAVMSKIEHHAHSFEHQPLQYLGLGAIRRSCLNFSECTLKCLTNQLDFDSAIPRFESWRPSHPDRSLWLTVSLPE